MKIDSVIFYTSDLNMIIEFYQNKVGFELEYRHGDEYVSFIFEDGVKLGIKKREGQREIPGSQTLIITANNVEELYEDIKSKDIKINKDLVEESWGTHFNFLDPDGNKVEFLRRN